MLDKRKYHFEIKNRYKKKQVLIMISLLMCVVSFVAVFGRYIRNDVNDFFVRSKEFYFFSDKLSENLSTFQVDNWSGVDDYTITVNMNSRKNNLEVASYDIPYDITYRCSDNAICQLSKSEGVISQNTNSDYFNLLITPNRQLNTGDKVVIEIEATSKEKYVKTIKGRFTLVVGKENLTYQITDKEQNPYMELSITNTLSYYVVREGFDNYTVGEKIDIDTYLALSDLNKSKCYSSIVTVEFDPAKILLDITNENYQEAIETNTINIGSNSFINSITLPIDAISSVNLRFYKVDATKDYTYPNDGNSSIVTVSSI